MTDLYDAQDYLPHQTRADDLIRRKDAIAQAVDHMNMHNGKDMNSFRACLGLHDAIAALPAVAAPGGREWWVCNGFAFETKLRAENYAENYRQIEIIHVREVTPSALDTPAPALMDELVEAAKAVNAAIESDGNLTERWTRTLTASAALSAVLAKIGGAA